MRRFVTIGLVLLATALACRSPAEILIGAALPLTGTLAWIGEQMHGGAKPAMANLCCLSAAATRRPLS